MNAVVVLKQQSTNGCRIAPVDGDLQMPTDHSMRLGRTKLMNRSPLLPLPLSVLSCLLIVCGGTATSAGEPLLLHLRSRVAMSDKPGGFQPRASEAEWDPA